MKPNNVCALSPHTPRTGGANWRTPCADMHPFQINANRRE